jgi:glycosyltransferase involved in cell wall biosynthesis
VQSIATLAEQCPGGGKTPALSAELRRRLTAGELDAVLDYRDAYAHDRPDADAAERLTRLPWSNGKAMLFVGALTVGKGLQSVIAALPTVLRRAPDAHLVIVGTGAYREVLEGLVHAIASGDDGLLEALTARGYDLERTPLSGSWPDVSRALHDPELRSAMRDAGPRFSDHVHFVGRLEHDLLRHLFPCADVAVFPSIIPEAYPLVLMEALSNGVLPAATSFSGFAEGLDVLVPRLGRDLVDRMWLPLEPEHRVAGIAAQLTALLSSTSEELSARLRAIAVADYDWTVRAEQMVAAYRRLCSP